MKQAEKLLKMLNDARKGGWALRKLNWVMGFVIPFNRRHNFVVKEIGDDFVRTYAPYKRKNFNHIRGIHACGIATIAEFATGLHLLRMVDASKYRIIMSNLQVEYHYQAKKALIAEARLDAETIKREILDPLETADTTSYTLTSEIKDVSGNHVATAHITWQFKAWAKVKTKV